MSSLLPNKFSEPHRGDDQRPYARYLRSLQGTPQRLDLLAIQQQQRGSHIPLETAYTNPFYWMCEMETNETFGRHLVADQDVKKGDNLGCEHPILYVTDNHDRCAECDRMLPCHHGVRCDKHEQGGCPLAFCSQKCRDWAWEHYHKVQDHELVGVVYSRKDNTPHFRAILIILKGLSMMALPRANKYALSYITSFFENTHLLSFASKLSMQGVCVDRIKKASGYTKADDVLVHKFFALHCLYAFASDEASYLFGPICLINHSCEGNVRVTGLAHHDTDVTKPFVSIQAQRPIKKGEQLFFDYRGDSMTPRSTRKANIKAQYGFDCHCRLCNDGIPRCDKCMAGHKKLKRCTKCKNAVYCSRDCQVKDWGHHKRYCALKAAGQILFQ